LVGSTLFEILLTENCSRRVRNGRGIPAEVSIWCGLKRGHCHPMLRKCVTGFCPTP